MKDSLLEHDGAGPRNRVRERWSRGEVAVDIWLTGASTDSLSRVGRLGYDSIVLDMQHGPIDSKDVQVAMLALAPCDVTPIVRVGWNDPATIMNVLDAGAQGVMCPVIDTRADAERFVGAVRYPPVGYRSFGPFGIHNQTYREYFEQANSSVLSIAQIETVTALDNLEQIVATPGLDMVFVGPADLSISGGGPPAIDYTDPVVVERHHFICDVAHSAGVKVGMLALDAEAVVLAAEWKVDFVSVGREILLLAGAAEGALVSSRKKLRREAAVSPAPGQAA